METITHTTIDSQKIAEHLGQAIKFKTVSYQDPAQFNSKEFFGLHRYLEETFSEIHSKLNRETIGDYSLLYTWKGREANLKPILLMAHMDVVPIEPGTEEHWSFPGFSGSITDDYIYGRGTLDFKVGLLGIFEAVEALLKQGFQTNRTIYLAFGHDEEVGGQRGAALIARQLQSTGVKLEFIIDEGLAITDGILPGISKPVALVGLTEKGVMYIELSVEAKGGHAMTAPRHTSIGILSTAIHKLEQVQFPARLEKPISEMFARLAVELPLPGKMVFANLWLFGGLVKKQLGTSPATNATIRTTVSTTIFEGGDRPSTLPKKARAVLRLAILPSDSISRALAFVQRIIDDPRVKITTLQDAFSGEPSPVSATDSLGFKIIEKTIQQVFPEVIVAPGLCIGATDARHYTELCNNIYRFCPFWLKPDDVNRIHGNDERISIENYKQIVEFYAQLISYSAF